MINYDLPEIAENFIHRVGRTGRAGGHGVASTLYAREQRLELTQLERTLGIKMERVPLTDARYTASERKPNRIEHVNVTPRVGSTAGSRMARLPGEYLQAQMGD